MKRIIGILIIVLVLYGFLLTFKAARTPGNHKNIEERLALYGILTLGAGILIISGGIDLSIGSVFCLAAVVFGLLLNARPSSVEKTFLAMTLGGGSVSGCCLVLAQLWGRATTLPLRLLVIAAALVVPVGLAYLVVRKLRPPRAERYSAAALPLQVGAAVVAVVLLYAAPVLLAVWLRPRPDVLAVLTVLVGGALVGLFHGVLVTGLRLQPFIVTLCGLFIWRGLAYWLALPDPLAPFRGVDPGSAGNVGIGEKSKQLQGLISLSTDFFELSFLDNVPVLNWFRFVPYRLCLLVAVAVLLAVLMHVSVYGRYLFAIGSNEQAARYAGIPSNRYKVLAYMLCSLLAALAGMLQLLELQTVSPSNTGSWFELFAITGAVLGGCSLRGGEGTVLGILLGTAVLPLLRNLSNFSRLPSDLEYMVIGVALLVGTIADELLKRRAARRG
jgi:ribose transport system permease protein